jgi:hypothetical protein
MMSWPISAPTTPPPPPPHTCCHDRLTSSTHTPHTSPFRPPAHVPPSPATRLHALASQPTSLPVVSDVHVPAAAIEKAIVQKQLIHSKNFILHMVPVLCFSWLAVLRLRRRLLPTIPPGAHWRACACSIRRSTRLKTTGCGGTLTSLTDRVRKARHVPPSLLSSLLPSLPLTAPLAPLTAPLTAHLTAPNGEHYATSLLLSLLPSILTPLLAPSHPQSHSLPSSLPPPSRHAMVLDHLCDALGQDSKDTNKLAQGLFSGDSPHCATSTAP